jgi:Ser/Thr protein kinase RdoA (MazF antagonist)
MDNETISRILQAYGYSNVKLLPLEKGYRNESHPFQLPSGNIVNLILYKNEPDSLTLIRNADRAADFAAAGSLPARQTADKRILRLQAGAWRKYGALYHYLPGHTIPWEAYTQEHIKLLGGSLSDLHARLQALPSTGYPLVTEQYQQLTKTMERYFAQSGVRAALERKLQLSVQPPIFDRFRRVLCAAAVAKDQQVLHMDFVRSNILFEEEGPIQVSGILDFEKAAVGHPAFDVARTLAFLLIDCKYKTEIQIRKYLISSGYQKRGSQKLISVSIKDHAENRPLLEELLDLFLVYDLYKFLRHNPYESLPDNEHFMRTVILLNRRGLVRYSKMIQ